MLVTLNDALGVIVPVNVPLKFTQARHTPTVASFSTVPVVAGKVSVVVPATAGAASVIAPLVSPEIITDDIFFLFDQSTTHLAPLGMVTVMPLFTVIGPTLCALVDVLNV